MNENEVETQKLNIVDPCRGHDRTEAMLESILKDSGSAPIVIIVASAQHVEQPLRRLLELAETQGKKSISPPSNDRTSLLRLIDRVKIDGREIRFIGLNQLQDLRGAPPSRFYIDHFALEQASKNWLLSQGIF